MHSDVWTKQTYPPPKKYCDLSTSHTTMTYIYSYLSKTDMRQKNRGSTPEFPKSCFPKNIHMSEGNNN